MLEEQHLTIGELAEAASVTPRTVRYYTTEGLLPPPDTRGRYALYGDEHLLRLRLIARLKDAYLPLGEIKSRMADLSGAQVARLLAEYEQSPTQHSSAADYLAQVLASSTAPSPNAQAHIQRPASEAKRANPQLLAEPKQLYTTGPEKNSTQGATSVPALPFGYATPAPPAPQTERSPGLLKRFAAERQASEFGAPTRSEETWQRFILAPGIELHVRDSLAPELRERVSLLFQQARELFGE